MEDVLDLYQPEYNLERPVVCFDETSRQLTGEVRPPIEAAPGRVARYDTEYQRNGTRNLFMICEPKGGWRHVEVTERRTAVDFAHQMRWLVDEAYPDAEVVRLVLDNLNTHKLGSLYEAFEPCEARRIAQRLEFHYTPTHGSWLNMAEIELSVFSRGCLNRRISDEPELRREVAALERERNAAKSAIDWRFTTQDARRKLQHIYPTKPDLNGTSSGTQLTNALERCSAVLENEGTLTYVIATVDPLSDSQTDELENARVIANDRYGPSVTLDAVSLRDLYDEICGQRTPARSVSLTCQWVAAGTDTYVGAATLVNVYQMLREYAKLHNGSLDRIYDRNVRKWLVLQSQI